MINKTLLVLSVVKHQFHILYGLDPINDNRETNECNGHLELCCIHDITHGNILVNIFSQV